MGVVQDVVIGRPREGADRVAWLAARRRFPEALAVAEQDAGIKAAARAALGEQYMQYLVDSEQYQAAAELAPRALRQDGAAWERWVYAFGQRRALACLAPRLPTLEPRLSAAAYDMALAALLRAPEGEQFALLNLCSLFCTASWRAPRRLLTPSAPLLALVQITLSCWL